MKAAVLFCHTDEQEPNAAVERELGRQYTNYLNTRMRMVLNWSKSFSTLSNWIMNIPMMYFCDFCVDCKIADRTLLSQKRETTSQRVK